MPSKYTPINRLNIPSFRDDAVNEYCAWQKSQVREPELKVEYESRLQNRLHLVKRK
jgi:hypothetical protein